MAKDPATSARDSGYGDGDRVSSPVLADWLLREVRLSRPPEPPPPEEEEEEPVTLPPAAQSTPPSLLLGAGVLAGSVIATAEQGPPPVEDIDEMEEPAPDTMLEPPMGELVEPPEALAAPLAEEATDEAVAPEAPLDELETAPAATLEDMDATNAVAASSAADWLDDGASFHPSGLFDEALETEALLAAPILEEGLVDENGSSLSPQVLTPGEEDDTDAALYVPGTGGGSSTWWLVAAAAAAALLLVVFFMHRAANKHTVATAAPPSAGEPARATATEAAADTLAGDAPATSAVAKGSSSGGGSRWHGAPAADTSSSDPALPGGPSVARFPDLPREILNQLEQVFEANEERKGKSSH